MASTRVTASAALILVRIMPPDGGVDGRGSGIPGRIVDGSARFFCKYRRERAVKRLNGAHSSPLTAGQVNQVTRSELGMAGRKEASGTYVVGVNRPDLGH